MKKNILLLLFCASIFNIIPLYSQTDRIADSARVYNFKGKLTDNENKPIVFAHVINKLRGHATITDSGGFFIIPVVYKDSLRISSIGFQTKLIFIKDKSSKDSILHQIKMAKKTYDLATVNIYELRWQVFKAEFMEETVKEDKTALRISNWMAHLVPSDELRMIFQASRGVGFSINYKTKAEKARRKVAEMEKKYQLIAPKYNDKMITSITGLKDDEIYKFIEYCNFDEEFLMHATEYEIMEEILVKWKEYQQYNKNRKITNSLKEKLKK